MSAMQTGSAAALDDAMSELELAGLRKETPAFAAYAHFAHGSASLPPDAVYRAWDAWIRAEQSMGAHRAADYLGPELHGVKASVAGLIGGQPHQIALLDSASHAWSTALDAVLAADAAVHVITTRDEYAANVRCLLDASALRRLSFSVLSTREPGSAFIERLEKALDGMAPGRIPVVSIGAIPTAFGGVTDLGGIAACVARHGGLFFVDASHLVGQQNVDVRAIGCDVLVFPSRKWLRGPKGLGVLYVSDRALGRLAPAQSIDMPDARRFEGHEFNPGLHLAFKAACDYARVIGPARIQRRNRQVRAMVASSLAARLGWVALEAEHPDRSALMTYRMDERTIPADTLVSRLWRAGINASCIGAQQAPWALEATGATTLLRLTPHYITSDEEIDRLARAIEDAMTLP